MGNGLLGKKVVSSRDTELVYTVPANQVATFNVNVLNNDASAGNVWVYVSDKTYQSKDFETYDVLDDSWTIDAKTPAGIVGFDQSALLTTMKTTSLDITNAGAVPVEVAQKIEVDNANATFSVAEVASTQDGMPLPFLDGTDWYVRSANNGSVYTLANFISAGTATTAASTWGQSAVDNNRWATNVEGSHAVAYINGTGVSGTPSISTITNYRDSTAATYANFSWAAGAISSMAGIKTTGEYFLTGVVFGTVYISSNGAPITAVMLQDAQFALTQVAAANAGIMVGATAVEGATAGEGNVFIALSSDRFIYSAYNGTTAVSSTASDWENSFSFPTGVTWEDLVSVEAGSAANQVIVKTMNTVYSTTDFGLTWTETPNTGVMPFNITIAADANAADKMHVNGILGGEVELVRGRTYRFYLQDSTNNTHPMLLSTTADGTHGGGAAYDTGVTYYLGDPTATAATAVKHTASADYLTDFATYNGQVKFIEITVASSAPDTLYAYCDTHAGEGFTISVIDAPTTAPHDDESVLVTASIWNTTNGDVVKKFDLFKNGETYSREKRFYELPDVDLFDKAGLGAGALLERTGIMASAGEQVIVKTDGNELIVRVHGIEEGVS